jgi:hypothetical protein
MGSIAACECGFDEVPVAPTLFTGDYHVRKHVNVDGSEKVRGASGQDLKVYSPGATNLRSIDESQDKYVMLYHDDSSWEDVELFSRRKYSYDIPNEEAMLGFKSWWKKSLRKMLRYSEDHLPQALQQPILWIQYVETMEEVQLEVEKIVGDEADVFYRRVKSVDNHAESVRAARREILDRGLVGCLELVVPKTNEQYAPLLRLLKSQDPAQELLNMRSERLNVKKTNKKKRPGKKGQAKKHNHPRKPAQDPS